MIRERVKIWLIIAALTICGTTCFASCSSNDDNTTKQSNITNIADKVWAFSQNHPNGFTLDIRTMTEPTEGIAVSFAATQNSHSCVPSVASELSSSMRDLLDKVVHHALQHEGYIGGWYNSQDGLYYFDSTKLFPENDLKGAIQFGKENEQHSIFILSTLTNIPLNGKVAEIIEHGTILIGTTGDYRPLSFCQPDGVYWGFDIEVATEIANRLGVNIEFKKTSWPTLATDINKPEVTVMVNPGGLNEKFANDNLTHANIMIHPKNEEIPTLIAEGVADVMITEITEAPYYVQTDSRLAAPLLNTPFTHGEIGVLMQKGQEDLLQMVNNVISNMKKDGSLRKLHEKYGLVYAYK